MFDEELELQSALESVFDFAMEASSHTIDPKDREKLPDSCFGVITTFPSGEKKRIYPLRVPGDAEKTHELVSKAIQFFHYCKEPLRAELAKNILKVIKSENLKVTINRGSQILKYVSESQFPKTVTFTEPKVRGRKKS